MKCPRCESQDIRLITVAPVDNAWEMYGCNKCQFSWRSTEDVVVLDKFKLNEEKIANMQMIPPIPPLG